LRLVVVSRDQKRAKELAEELREVDVTVEVLEGRAKPDLTAAREIDPEVVLLDPTGLGGASFALTRALNGDEQLRWAPILRCELKKFWRDREPVDLRALASLLSPLVDAARSLSDQIETDDKVITELDRIGPNRALRILESSEGSYALAAQSPDARAELTFDDGVLATATYHELHVSGPPVRGPAAIEGFKTMRTGLLEIERMKSAPLHSESTRRTNPYVDLLDETRNPLADDSLITAPYDRDVLSDADEIQGEKTLVESDHPTAPLPEDVFPLPQLVDEPPDEETQTDPPAPPRPSVSPREAAELKSTKPGKKTLLGTGAPFATPKKAAPAPPRKATSSPPPAPSQRSSSRPPPGPSVSPSQRPSPRSSPSPGPNPSPSPSPSPSQRPSPSPSASPSTPPPAAAAPSAPPPKPSTPPASPARSARPERSPSGLPLGLLAAAVLGIGAFVLTAAIVWMSSGDDGEQMVASPIAAEGVAEVTGTETDSDSDSDSDPEAETETEAETGTDSDSETDSDSDSETETDSDSDSETEAVTETETAAATTTETPATPRDRANEIVDEADRLELPANATRALALYEEALEVDGINAGASAGIARVHLATNHPDQALEPAQTAVRLAPNRSGFKILLGDVHIALRDREAARDAWLAAYEIRPSERVRRRLDRIGYDPEGGSGSGTGAPTTSGGADEGGATATSEPTAPPAEAPADTEPPAAEPTMPTPVAEGETTSVP
jgi:hypothetical protein